jgi:hypothetical protein
MVKHLSHNPKMKGLDPACTRRVKMFALTPDVIMKVIVNLKVEVLLIVFYCNFVVTTRRATVAQWQNICIIIPRSRV